MAKYLISWEESTWMDLEIEAASREEALEKFANNDYNKEDVKEVGGEWLPDTLEVAEA